MVTPAVVAHRGASGYRPEHTLDAYRMAIRMGADDIELDLVISADGVLVVRHESELSETTDVARLLEFASRRRTRLVDGRRRTGWFADDFTIAELKHLTATERWPSLRPASAAYDGRCGVPTFNEVLAMVRAESVREGRTIGVMAELKHAHHYASLGLSMEEAMLADLRRHDLDHARSRVSVMSLEVEVLRRLATQTQIPVVQLLGPADHHPVDLRASGDRRTFGDLTTPAGLDEIDEYADGIGPHTSLLLPPDAAGRIESPSSLVREAHRRWLTVHAWTLRAERRFLPSGVPSLSHYARRLLDAGVDGLITDHPDLALRAVTRGRPELARRSPAPLRLLT